MFQERVLSVYFYLVTFTGIFPISLRNGKNIISTKFDKKSCIFAYIFNISIALINFIFMCNFRFEIEGDTAQGMGFIEENLVFFTYIFVQTWFFSYKSKTFYIVNTIFKNNLKFYGHITSKQFSLNLKIFLMCNLIYHLYAFGYFVLNIIIFDFTFESLFSFISRSVNYFVSSLVLSFYTSLIENIENILIKINKRLSFLISKNKSDFYVFYKIHEILKVRDNLLTICRTEISFVFGVPFILMTMLVFIVLSHEISLALWIFDNESFFLGMILTDIYFLIGLIIHVRVFSCNNLWKEVSF